MTRFDKTMRAMDEAEAVVSFREVLEAKADGCPVLLNEVSLSRVYRHVTKGEPWAIITSWRAGLSPAENRKRLGQLQGQIRSLGLGFFKLMGHWRECQDDSIPYKDCPPDQLVDAVEPSLFVPGLKQRDAVRLMARYDQDAIVYAGPETDGKVSLLYRQGGQDLIGTFHPGRIAQAYSRLKGRTFTFEGFEYVAQGHVEAMVEQVFWREQEVAEDE